jgi:hypothetical protein
MSQHVVLLPLCGHQGTSRRRHEPTLKYQIEATWKIVAPGGGEVAAAPELVALAYALAPPPPFLEAWAITPLMPFPCMHGLTGYGPSAFTAGLLGLPAGVHGMMSIKEEC